MDIDGSTFTLWNVAASAGGTTAQRFRCLSFQ